MTRSLAWIRKSKGNDDDIGLVEQRNGTCRLARQLTPTWDHVDVLDLGIQTGFSSLSRDNDASQLLDERADVKNALKALRKGAYDYVAAWDDRRICRDGYFEVIRHAANQGGAELVYVADVAQDELTHDLKRRIERDTKEEEIKKSRQAIEARKERGYDHGRPKFGMTYDDAGHYQVPGEDFETVMEILQRRADGETFAAIADAVGEAESTVRNVFDREEWYRNRAERTEGEIRV
jgi:DNA invertase Pin-like site-specific DNA recombinase